MNAILWAIASAAAVVTFAEGALAYRKLPAIVPLRFDVRGRPGFRGPRLVLLGIFSVTAALIFATFFVPIPASSREPLLAGSLVAALVFVAFTQHLIIDAIVNRSEQLAMRPFWVGSAILVLAALVLRTSSV